MSLLIRRKKKRRLEEEGGIEGLRSKSSESEEEQESSESEEEGEEEQVRAKLSRYALMSKFVELIEPEKSREDATDNSWPTLEPGKWKELPFSKLLSGEQMEELFNGFEKLHVEELIRKCRREDNSPYSDDEINSMMQDLDSGRKTLNLPFCFCEGAKQLVLQAASLFHSHDIEVGLYISKVGGDIATWHYDDNHNFTIQLQGSKEWKLAYGDCSIGNRGIQDHSRNKFESECLMPHFYSNSIHRVPYPVNRDGLPNRLIEYSCGISELEEDMKAPQNHWIGTGSLLYVPAGHWHMVTPVASDPYCISVNIRMADRKSTRLNSSHPSRSRMPSSA